MDFTPLIQTTLGLSVLYALWRYILYLRRPPFPPGPKGLPLVGNIADLPAKDEADYLHWMKHRSYGPVTSVTILGQTLVVIHDQEAAFEILDKRAAKHSSRPWFEFACGMCGFKEYLGFLQDANRVRANRKLAHMEFGTPKAAAKYHARQTIEAGRFLVRTLNDPKGVLDHVKTYAGALVMHMLYGYTINPHSRDPLLALGDEMNQNFTQACLPGKWMVDIIPFLRYLPDWAPGAGFKKVAREMKAVNEALVQVPLDLVKDRMAHGSQPSSFVSNLLEDERSDHVDEHEIKWIAGAMYAAGTNTYSFTIQWFILAMMMYPEVQEKAQEEIDRVIGTSRLPTHEDRKNLPYVSAVVHETLRWEPVGSLGVPHMTTENDVYQGHLIPKGATLITALWWYAHDPKYYHDPESFKPERYSAPYNEPMPQNTVFGFGRRVCAGRPFAEPSLWIAVAQTLAAFIITKVVDDKGREIQPEKRALLGLLNEPVPFPVTVTPRSENVVELIRQFEAEHPWEEGDAKLLNRQNLPAKFRSL